MKDILLAVAPAFFGLMGVVAGALIGERSASTQRRIQEDNEARAVVTDLLAAANQTSGRYAPGPGGTSVYIAHAPHDYAALARRAKAGQVALLAAGVPWRTASTGYVPVSGFVDLLEDTSNAAKDDQAAAYARIESANGAIHALTRFLDMLDRSRRYRRSSRFARRMGVPFSDRHPRLWRAKWTLRSWLGRRSENPPVTA